MINVELFDTVFLQGSVLNTNLFPHGKFII